MARTAKLAIAVAVPLLVGGWAAFRPELLFVQTRVQEAAPDAASSRSVAKGTFVSLAHETSGTAQLIETNGKTILRLADFATSNGPDVHVYLLKGRDSTQVKPGEFIDLGVIKGTQGSQNYELPSGTDAAEYGAVAIWCKRFSLNFGGADLKSSVAYVPAYGRLASFTGQITVTSGPIRGKARGEAAIVERDGKRYLRLTNVRASASTSVFLVKAESAARPADVARAEKIPLGALKAGREVYLPISKSLDVWLWRSVAFAGKDGKPVAYADLRSDQERSRPLLLA